MPSQPTVAGRVAHDGTGARLTPEGDIAETIPGRCTAGNRCQHNVTVRGTSYGDHPGFIMDHLFLPCPWGRGRAGRLRHAVAELDEAVKDLRHLMLIVTGPSAEAAPDGLSHDAGSRRDDPLSRPPGVRETARSL